MAVVSLSNVPTPQFHHYGIPHPVVFEQYKTPTQYCNIRHTLISTKVKLQRCTALAQAEYSYSKEFTGECKSTPSKALVNESAIDKQIKALTSKGFHGDAIKLYIDLLDKGLATGNFLSYPALVKAVGSLCDLKLCCQIHGHLLKLAVIKDVYVANSLLSVLWKVGAIDDAIRMFKAMEVRDSVSWSTMISGFHQSRLHTSSLEWFRCMSWESHPNRVACTSALSSCASVKSLIHGREIHTFVIKNGLDIDAFVLNGLLDMYMKCGHVGFAEQLFRIIPEDARENPVLWNVMISGYVENGYVLEALQCFIKMMMSGIEPDTSTMVALLVLCSESSNLTVGEQIHALSIKLGLDLDVRVGTSLTDMYFNCDNLERALKLFDMSHNRNLVMWGTVISKCTRSGFPRKALDLFIAGFEHGFLDSVTLLAALRACSSLVLNAEGKAIHGMAVKLGFNHDTFIGTALIDMYSKCKDMASAQNAFLRLSVKDDVTWSTLISGYAQNECWDDAVKAFYQMHHHDHRIKPNAVLIACLLSICARVFTNLQCKEIHSYIIRHGFDTNVLVNNSLLIAYSKCGDLGSAQRVFLGMENKDEVSWNSIMLALGQHGYVDEVFRLFKRMKETGTKPDHQTFTAILSACSHTGRVAEGLEYFRSMSEEHMLKPKLEQYTCLVDLLGRAGYLEQAYELIMTMPYHPDDRVWGSLLGSCRNHGDERLVEIVANHIFELDSCSIGYRVLLANLYEESGKWREGGKHRARIKDMGLKKSPGCSWIDVDNQIHVFTAGDRSHREVECIYDVLGSLTMEMRKEGYVPQL